MLKHVTWVMVAFATMCCGCVSDIEETDDEENTSDTRQPVTVNAVNGVCWGSLGVYPSAYSGYYQYTIHYGNKVYAYYPAVLGLIKVDILSGTHKGKTGWVAQAGISKNCL